MTRQRITIEIAGTTIFAIRGWKAHGLALGAGLRPTFSGVHGAWIADTKRLPDLLAYLQRRNVPVEVVYLSGVTTVSPDAPQAPRGADNREASTTGTTVPTEPDQLDLFGGGDE